MSMYGFPKRHHISLSQQKLSLITLLVHFSNGYIFALIIQNGCCTLLIGSFQKVYKLGTLHK